MSRTADPALEEAGLTEEIVAASISRVFGKMVGQDEVGEYPGWLSAVRLASTVIGGGGESDVQIHAQRFADDLRHAYSSAIDPDYQPTHVSELSESARLGWQAVARHVCNVFAMDPQEARRLEQHEDNIVQYVKTRSSATPK